MRMMRDWMKFQDHPEWYTEDKGRSLWCHPTKDTPKEIFDAIIRHNILFCGMTNEEREEMVECGLLTEVALTPFECH